MNKPLVDFIDNLIKGQFDNDLDYIVKNVQARHRQVGAMKMFQLREGDRVRFNDSTKPKYLIGQEGTVRKVNRTKIVVDLDARTGNFFKNINTPAALVDKVETTVNA